MLGFDLFVTWQGEKKNQCFLKGKNKINRERHLLFKPSERVLKHEFKKKKPIKTFWQCNFNVKIAKAYK